VEYTASKFHVVVDRQPLRAESAAWQRVSAAQGDLEIPTAFQSWAATSSFAISSSSSSEVNHHAGMDATPSASVEEPTAVAPAAQVS
jgi:hypothetical protein